MLIVTNNDIEGVHKDLPVGRDPDVQIYFRSESKKEADHLLMTQ